MNRTKQFSKIWRSFSPAKRYGTGFAVIIIASVLLGSMIQLYVVNTIQVPKQGGEYSEAVVGLPRFINPVLAQLNDIDRDLARLIYPSLLVYDNSGSLIPSLAESYEVQNGSMEYVFSMQKDALWEDGEPITSADVLFTVGLIQDPKYASPLRQNWVGVEVRAEDDYTVRFILSSPYVPFPENVTLGILPKHIWENVASQSFPLADANLRPVGGGPYKFEKFQKDTSGYILSYKLKRNEKYFGDSPNLDSITFRFFETPEDAIKAHNRKVVDGISFIPTSLSGDIRPKSRTEMHEFQMPRYFALFFNESKAPVLQSKKIREALRYAINKQEIITDALKGLGAEANSPIPSFMESFNPDAALYEFNPELATELLEEEGWYDNNEDGVREKTTRGESMLLEVSLATVDWPELREAAEYIANQLQAVGVHVNVEFYPIGGLQQDIIRPREYQILLFGEVLSVNPDPFSFWHSSQKKDPGLNLSLYENGTVDRLLEEARQEQDPVLRIEKLKEFQMRIVEDVAAIFLYNPSYLYGINKKIKGIEAGVIADPSWRFVDVQKWFMETKRIWK